MVPSAASCRWSSYQGNTGHAHNKLLTAHEEYLALGADDDSRQRAYRQMLEQAEEAAFLAAIRDATNGGLALVDDQLKSRLEADTGRRLEHKKPGPVAAEKPADLANLSAELGF
jgi:putative transposase